MSATDFMALPAHQAMPASVPRRTETPCAVRRFAASATDPPRALPSAPDKKIISQRQLTYLRVQSLQVYRRLARGPACCTEHIGCTLLQLPLPFRDPVRMHIEPLCQFGQRALAPDRRQGHFRLERR
ncbi:hypothetical protein GE569_24130 [Burkholderia gladioli]